MVAEASSIVLQGAAAASDELASSDRLTALVRGHFAYVWRVLRRLGLSSSDADDVTQLVFLTASRRIPDITPDAERAFLYRTAIHVAYRYRRTGERRREDFIEDSDVHAEPGPAADDLLDRHRAREMLDEIVAAMPLDFRVVFVLYEIEGLATTDIARVLGIPVGTVASRLRRARADFEARVGRLEARRRSRGVNHG